MSKKPWPILHSAKAVLRFYMAADVVLVASLNEVLPLVICESMGLRAARGLQRPGNLVKA